MGISVGKDSDEADFHSSINTTPLVDVMLVLLIIFLITIPVVTQSIPLALPKERNLPTQTQPENILLSVNQQGEIYWGTRHVASLDELEQQLKKASTRHPPEVHIRGDQETRYESIDRVVNTCQRAGIAKVGFITEPPPNGQ
jgi:biopolymer transport protein ExbD